MRTPDQLLKAFKKHRDIRRFFRDMQVEAWKQGFLIGLTDAAAQCKLDSDYTLQQRSGAMICRKRILLLKK